MTSLISQIVDYWNQQPCNTKHSAADPKSEQYWNEITKKRYFVEPHIYQLAEFHRWQGKRVLEIGCGIGTDAEQFVRHGAEYVGVDISSTSIDLCKLRFQVQNLSGDFHCLDAGDLNQVMSLGKFDLVYSMGVIHHYPRPRDIVANAYELLNDSGEFRFLVYAANSWKYAMIQAGLDQYEAQAGCPYAEPYDEDKISILCLGLFDITEIEQNHCFMYNVEKYKQGIYELEPWFAAMSENMRSAVRKQLGWHLSVKAQKKEPK